MADERTTPDVPVHAFTRVLRQRAWVVVLCAVLVPLVAYVTTSRQSEQFVASAQLLLGGTQVTAGVLGGEAVGAASDEGVAATSLDLASIRTIAERTSSTLGGGVSVDAVADIIEVIPRGESRVVDVEATGASREQVAPIANAYAEEFIAFREERARSELVRAEAIVNEQIAGADRAGRQGRAEDLREQRDELGLLAELQSGDAELVERATTPGGAASPQPRRAAALGLGFGLVLGIGLALLFELLSRRLTDPKEAEELFEGPLLGTIPTSRALRGDRGRGAPALSSIDQAAFQRVRGNLVHYNDFNVSSILVVSALPDEGKSTVAWNLAVAAVEAGASVLLLEGDMRLPSFVRMHGLPAGQGLDAVLTGRAEPDEVIRRVSVAGGSNGRSARALDVICAGEAHADPTYLLESQRMEHLILDLEERYELVVVDTPPTLVVPDSMALVDHVSGVVVVTRMGKNTRDSADQLRRQLEHARAPLLGIVINGVDPAAGYPTYHYTYEASEPADAVSR